MGSVINPPNKKDGEIGGLGDGVTANVTMKIAKLAIQN
jgi:hypothetical protein